MHYIRVGFSKLMPFLFFPNLGNPILQSISGKEKLATHPLLWRPPIYKVGFEENNYVVLKAAIKELVYVSFINQNICEGKY